MKIDDKRRRALITYAFVSHALGEQSDILLGIVPLFRPIAPMAGMIEALRRDYSNTAAMIFGTAPTFDQILASVTALDAAANRAAS
jgi:hypothetical protein